MIEILLLGIGISIIPTLFCKNKDESSVFKCLSIINFIIFGTIGILFMLSTLFGADKLSLISSVVAFFFMVLSICGIILSSDKEFERIPKHGKSKGGHFLMLLGVITLSIGGSLWIVYTGDSTIALKYWGFMKVPWIEFTLIGMSILFLIFVVLDPLKKSSKAEHQVYCPNPNILISKRKIIGAPILLISLILIISLVGFFCYKDIYYGKADGVMYIGEVDTVEEAGDALGTTFMTVMSQPEFVVVVVLVLIGGLAKTVSGNVAAELASNVLIIWLPGFMWTLVIMGAVGPPNVLIRLFGGIEFLAYLMYVLIYGVLMIAISAAISVFQSLK